MSKDITEGRNTRKQLYVESSEWVIIKNNLKTEIHHNYYIDIYYSSESFYYILRLHV